MPHRSPPAGTAPLDKKVDIRQALNDQVSYGSRRLYVNDPAAKVPHRERLVPSARPRLLPHDGVVAHRLGNGKPLRPRPQAPRPREPGTRGYTRPRTGRRWRSAAQKCRLSSLRQTRWPGFTCTGRQGLCRREGFGERQRETAMQQATIIGIDLAKTPDDSTAQERTVRSTSARSCHVGTSSRSSRHALWQWLRSRLRQRSSLGPRHRCPGHQVRLIAPVYVKPLFGAIDERIGAEAFIHSNASPLTKAARPPT